MIYRAWHAAGQAGCRREQGRPPRAGRVSGRIRERHPGRPARRRGPADRPAVLRQLHRRPGRRVPHGLAAGEAGDAGGLRKSVEGVSGTRGRSGGAGRITHRRRGPSRRASRGRSGETRNFNGGPTCSATRTWKRSSAGYYTSNETPEEPIQQVDGFRLSRWPTINAWYRLFDPGHGTNESWYREVYSRISPDADTPVIFVTWYDAWAFCLWAVGRAQLPVAARTRMGIRGQGRHAVGPELLVGRRVRLRQGATATKTSAARRRRRRSMPTRGDSRTSWATSGNGARTSISRAYSRDEADDPTGSSARVLRGGSWGNFADWAAFCVPQLTSSGVLRRQCWFSRGQGSCKILVLFPFFSPRSLAAGERAKILQSRVTP